MEWIVATGLTFLLAAILPFTITAAKKSLKGNSQLAGAALAIGLAFSVLFDPRRQEVVERTVKRTDEDGEVDHADDDEPQP